MPRAVYNHEGKRLELGRQLGTGGEGAVYEVRDAPNFVAKVYHKPPSADKVAKLRAMVAAKNDDLLRIAAWPSSTLQESPHSAVVGLLMPKAVGYKESHVLYGPAHRFRDFPKADWSFLVQTAMNAAVAFEMVHRNGHVIGDVNQSNVLVGNNATTFLIDCDSFQIRTKDRFFLCDVGVPQYTPPELQGKGFRGVHRTVNHDRFGLAVLVFHLLFMGRHPFAGRFGGRGEMPLERAIREYRFAFGRSASSVEMEPPPFSLSLEAVTSTVAMLFEKAFHPSSSTNDSRPSGLEWMNALTDLKKQLRTCGSDHGHKFINQARECPWCALMGRGGPNFFIALAVQSTSSGTSHRTFVLAVVWAEIERVAPPNTRYQRPRSNPAHKITPTPLPAGVPRFAPPPIDLPRDFFHKMVASIALAGLLTVIIPVVAVFGIVVAVIFGVWAIVIERQFARDRAAANKLRENAIRTRREERQRRERICKQAEANLAELEMQSGAIENKYRSLFSKAKTELDGLKQRHRELENHYNSDRRSLQNNVEKSQRDQYLQAFFIGDVKIPGIGPSRQTILRSYGVETAYDVDSGRIDGVPGFGPVYLGRLVSWKNDVARGFKFDAASGVPKSELLALQTKYSKLRYTVETDLLNGPQQLRHIVVQHEQHMARLIREAETRVLKVLQANADVAAVTDRRT